jgi:predicted metalloprotease
MRWKGRRRSSNVEDRRGHSPAYNTAGSRAGLLNFIPMLIKTKTGRIMLLIGVVPDSFTHGTSAQRVRWFRRGFESGDINACDTFSVSIN